MFFAKSGTFVNYYMYHGRTNFGRSGGPFITRIYDYDAPIDEYGIPREPKWTHLRNLNIAIKLCSDDVLYGRPETFSLGPSQETHVYSGEGGLCAAFLCNRDSKADVKNKGLLEHISTTKDTPDYLWYLISVDVNEDDPFLRSNISPLFAIGSHGYAVHVFLNNNFVGSANANKTTPGFYVEIPISLSLGKNDIAILSVMVGLPNLGAHFERKSAGIRNVVFQGFKDGTHDLSQELWTYQIGLVGERLIIYSNDDSHMKN